LFLPSLPRFLDRLGIFPSSLPASALFLTNICLILLLSLPLARYNTFLPLRPKHGLDPPLIEVQRELPSFSFSVEFESQLPNLPVLQPRFGFSSLCGSCSFVLSLLSPIFLTPGAFLQLSARRSFPPVPNGNRSPKVSLFFLVFLQQFSFFLFE